MINTVGSDRHGSDFGPCVPLACNLGAIKTSRRHWLGRAAGLDGEIGYRRKGVLGGSQGHGETPGGGGVAL